MRSIFPFAAIGFLMPAMAAAQAGEAAHYAGEMICSDRIFVHLDIAAGGSARLSSRSRGSDYFTEMGQGRAEIAGDALRLFDGDQPRWLQGTLDAGGKELAVTLLDYNAAPDPACRPGILTRLDGTAQAHNEALLALLENGAPSLEDAGRVAAMQRLRHDLCLSAGDRAARHGRPAEGENRRILGALLGGRGGAARSHAGGVGCRHRGIGKAHGGRQCRRPVDRGHGHQGADALARSAGWKRRKLRDVVVEAPRRSPSCHR